MAMLLGEHPHVAPGQPVDVRLASILKTFYDGDVTAMRLAAGGIRSRNGAKGGPATAANAAARTAGTFQSLCCVLFACLTYFIHHFPHSW